jgi:hypothetical protein
MTLQEGWRKYAFVDDEEVVGRMEEQEQAHHSISLQGGGGVLLSPSTQPATVALDNDM